MVKDLQLRHHRRTDRTDLTTVLHFGRTDRATVIEFVEAHQEAVLAALVMGSDCPSTFGLPAVRETTPVAKLHHSSLTGPSTPPRIYSKDLTHTRTEVSRIKRSLFTTQLK